MESALFMLHGIGDILALQMTSDKNETQIVAKPR